MEIIFPLIIMASIIGVFFSNKNHPRNGPNKGSFLNQYDNTTHLTNTTGFDFNEPTCTDCCGDEDDDTPWDDSVPDSCWDNNSCDTGSADCDCGDSGGSCD